MLAATAHGVRYHRPFLPPPSFFVTESRWRTDLQQAKVRRGEAKTDVLVATFTNMDITDRSGKADKKLVLGDWIHEDMNPEACA